MTVTSAHELLTSRDCLEYGCTNDAGPEGVCEEHVMWRTARGAELARRAVDLRAEGWSMYQVGKRLGVGRAYASSLYNDPTRSKERARKDGYRLPCPKCGRPMDGSNGVNRPPSLCLACSRQKQHDERIWTRERIIEAIQAFAALVGRPPVSQEWLYKINRPSLPDPPEGMHAWPWVAEVLREFGKWADAIEAAGFDRPYVGQKVRSIRPRGQRRLDSVPTNLEYVVFKTTDEGLHEIGRAMAPDPSHALERVVTTQNGHGDEFWVLSVGKLGAPFRVEARPVFVRVAQDVAA